jgi:hypothetical protein
LAAAAALLTVGACTASSDGVGDAGADGGVTGAGGAGRAGTGGAPGFGGSPDGGGAGPVLTVAGRELHDTCGRQVLARGIEVSVGLGFEINGSLANMIGEVAKTGANAVRILPNVQQLTPAQIATVVDRAVQEGMIVYISPGDTTWFGRSEVISMLAPYQPYLIVDAYQEAAFDDPARWLAEATAAVQMVRSYGYRVPLTVISNQGGRDLPSLLAHGAEIEAADPLGDTILGWQAYWGNSGWYQQVYGMTLDEAMTHVNAAPFPIQLGLDALTDATVHPTETLDYASLMNAAQTDKVGWLWWDWRLLGGPKGNDLSTDGTFAHLASVGQDVITTQPAGIADTAVKVCKPPM